MAKFIYIADSHFAVAPMRYQQQRGYPEKTGEIVALLDDWIRRDGDIDFVLHGGDMIDSTSKKNILGAKEMFRFSVPVYLCLGNHDLTESDAVKMWLDLAGEFFPDNGTDYSLRCGGCVIHVVPNQWGQTPWYWRDEMKAHFLADQLARLRSALDDDGDATHILSTHSEVLAIPPEQTGFDAPYHVPAEDFTQTVLKLIREHPRIRCVLSAHNHINMNVKKAGVHFVTPGAFIETPFDFKLIEANAKTLKMSTISLADFAEFKTDYDFNKTFVQGRETDRSFEESF